MSFWDIIWFIIVSFAFVAYLMVMFSIITDLFRDDSTSGVVKGVWIVALIFLPLLASLVYLVARGRSMSERSARSYRESEQATQAYIREVAGSSPADEIAKAKDLLDAGAIDANEFAALKARAVGGEARVPTQGATT